jgi:hypothetical protein
MHAESQPLLLRLRQSAAPTPSGSPADRSNVCGVFQGPNGRAFTQQGNCTDAGGLCGRFQRNTKHQWLLKEEEKQGKCCHVGASKLKLKTMSQCGSNAAH